MLKVKNWLGFLIGCLLVVGALAMQGCAAVGAVVGYAATSKDAMPAQKSLVYQDANMALALHFKPCEAKEVLQFIEADKHHLYQAASFVWQGRGGKACWTDIPADLVPEPTVFIVDEDGDAGPMPKSAFKEDDGKTLAVVPLTSPPVRLQEV
jgi:hypothetical protein